MCVRRTLRRRGLLALVITLLLAGCSTSPVYSPNRPPEHVAGDACKLNRYDRTFLDAARKAERRWGVPAHVLLAFVHKESRFAATARSASGAYGYPQAKDGTWREYQKATGRWDASREDIYDALDFIGWYNYVSHKRLGISRWDAYRLYLAYHEGRGGYQRRTYERRPWVKRLARKVADTAWRYRQQMKRCGLAR
ncbi:transglycosylase SLT domain-containing protein [Sulfurivirga sp.]|uniref:transglycosylase SLT domain-containing protein n=1 Tax=Sulfurivirga sp. TaxID=2614236 RepID=UPI0025D6DCC2|nr:transglycosylase SLT domain-containing protein [Sulfurivirga sp.]